MAAFGAESILLFVLSALAVSLLLSVDTLISLSVKSAFLRCTETRFCTSVLLISGDVAFSFRSTSSAGRTIFMLKSIFITLFIFFGKERGLTGPEKPCSLFRTLITEYCLIGF
jgi:hypothetical protein